MVLTRELETLFFILIASAIGLYAALHIPTPKKFNPAPVVAALPHFTAPEATPTPILTVPVPKVTTTSWTSSDGLEKIAMKTTYNFNASKTYTFTLTDTQTNVDKLLFIQTLAGVSSMSIPFNVFSSDNSYLFLKEIIGKEIHFLVFRTDGTPFPGGKNYLDVSQLFSAHITSYILADATGWASTDLLVINTKRQDGTQGPSFWFEAPSSFIQLSNVFD